MKIAICTYSFNPNLGGVERVGNIISTMLSASGFEVFGISEAQFSNDDNVKWTAHYSGTCYGNLNTPKSILSITDFIKKNKIDILINLYFLPYETLGLLKSIKNNTSCKIINSKQVAPSFLSALKIFNRPLPIPYCINHAIFSIYKKLVHEPRLIKAEQEAYSICDATVLLSKSFISEFARCNKLPECSKLHYIHNSIGNITHLNSKKDKTILSLGRLCNLHKRIDRILNFWRLFHQKGDGWNLKIVGDGEDREMLESLASDMGLTDLTFNGSTDIPEKFFSEAKIFLMTSETEGFGMTIIEAMANGSVPIVMDTFSAVHEIITNKKDGMIVPKEDYQAMISAVNHINDNFEEMSENARISSKKFYPQNIANNWIDLINSLKQK